MSTAELYRLRLPRVMRTRLDPYAPVLQTLRHWRGSLLRVGIATGVMSFGTIANALLFVAAVSGGPLGIAALTACCASTIGIEVLRSRTLRRLELIADGLVDDLALQASRRSVANRGESRDEQFERAQLPSQLDTLRNAAKTHFPHIALDSVSFGAAAVGAFIIAGLNPVGFGLVAAVLATGAAVYLSQRKAVRRAQHDTKKRAIHEQRARELFDAFLEANSRSFHRNAQSIDALSTKFQTELAKTSLHSQAFSKHRFRSSRLSAAMTTALAFFGIGIAVATAQPLLGIPAFMLATQAMQAASRIPDNRIGSMPGLRAAKTVGEFLKTPLRIDDPANGIELDTTKAISISLANVCFAHTNGHEVLRDTSMRIRPGEIVAIQSPNGAGKSTLLSLLERKEDICRGEIFIENTPIRAIRHSSLDQTIASFPTQPHILTPTLQTHSQIYSQRYNDSDIAEALKIVGLDAHVAQARATGALPPVTSRMSSGQRQRLQLARALLEIGKRPVLLLDEPTAHIDTDGYRIMGTLLKKARIHNTTVIFATHDTRLTSLATTAASIENMRVITRPVSYGTTRHAVTTEGVRQRPSATQGPCRKSPLETLAVEAKPAAKVAIVHTPGFSALPIKPNVNRLVEPPTPHLNLVSNFPKTQSFGRCEPNAF